MSDAENGTTVVRPAARLSHVVVNVVDLERSRAFYEATTPLRATARSKAPEQALPSLGVAHGEFDGYVMRDPAVPNGPAIHLWQWHSPKPVGSPYKDFTNLGLFRICFQSSEVEQVHGEVVAAGGVPFTAPLLPEGDNVIGRPVFSFADPDGIVIEYVTRPGRTRLFHVNSNCSDIDRSVDFCERFLGLRCYHRIENRRPVRSSFEAEGRPATCKGALLADSRPLMDDGRAVLSLDLVQWTLPSPVQRPYGVQNHVGIVRLGVAVEDLYGARAALVAAMGADEVSEPEVRDYGREVGVRRCVVFRDVDGVTVEFIEPDL